MQGIEVLHFLWVSSQQLLITRNPNSCSASENMIGMKTTAKEAVIITHFPHSPRQTFQHLHQDSRWRSLSVMSCQLAQLQRIARGLHTETQNTSHSPEKKKPQASINTGIPCQCSCSNFQGFAFCGSLSKSPLSFTLSATCPSHVKGF